METPHSPRTILCIDDEADALLLTRRVLEKAGYQLITTRSSEEGLRILQKSKVDAVVLDYWLPGKRGVEIGREIRALKPDIPIIILSGYSEILDEAVGVANAWITKQPGRSEEQLLRALKKLLPSAK